LYPKPRDFRTGKFRLVSTSNGVPTEEDLDTVLVRGMPGSSMPPWAHLSKEERTKLVQHVMQLFREGLRDQYIKTLKEGEELTDEQLAEEGTQKEIEQFVAFRSTAGESTVVPSIGEPDAAAIARGRETYVKLSCHSCHGNEGKGDGVQKMVDDEGYATRPRDYTQGIFKGGHDPASLFRRTAYGMPGTPMPSTGPSTASPEQIIDLVHYLRSLSDEDTRAATILKRESLIAKAVDRIPLAPDDPAWGQVKSCSLKMVPLWWRDNADPGLEVQLAHDGQTLAMRLTWNDASQNDRAVKPEEFEDMVAAQFCRAGAEPFLGMGGAEAIVDLWHWRGGLAQTGAEDQLMDDYPFDTAVYTELAQGEKLPDFVTARVADNPLALRQHSAGNLGAGGLGSTTFRPPASQCVSAEAVWNDGRWTVVMTRPLSLTPDDGLALAAGGRCSVAFAVWDGAARDRAAQKVISIWNDLYLE
jgi:mono/diheme cytochrome c family protein